MDILQNTKREGIFLSNSLDLWMFPASRDVFTGFLAQSVHDLWPIKLDGPLWPARDLKGMSAVK